MSSILMKPMDAAWFYVEKPDAPAHFGPLIILTPPPDSPKGFIRGFVEQWRQCKIFAAPFNYRLRRSALPAWDVLDDADVDLDYHLRHSSLPEPGGERELGVLISRLQSHRLDRRRPLWECHVIEGLENGRFAIYLKLHHGQLDGVGAARLMSRVFSTDPQARGLMPPWCIGMASARRPADGRGTTSGKHVASKSAGIQATLGALPAVVKSLAQMTQAAFSGSHPEVVVPFQAPKTIFNGRISAQRRFATQKYELSRFKLVAKTAQVTLNDVFLSISGGALRRYLSELDALPDRSLIGQVPVNIRPAGDTSIGNSIAFIYARLHSDIEDSVERLKAVHRSTEAAKHRHESVPSAGIESFTMLLLGPYMAQVILGFGGYTAPAANLVISNVPGPKERLYFNGAKVDQIYGPSVLFHGQALNITMSSYVDEVHIGYTGCRDSLPSMQKLAVYTGDALEDLEAALQIKSVHPR